MEERSFDREDTTLLSEVLFDIRRFLALIVGLIEGGDGDDGREEEEDDDPDQA